MKILVISNNFLSDFTNNGKTLKFLLSKYDFEDIRWVYTTPLITDLKCDVRKLLVSPFRSKFVFESSFALDKKSSSNAAKEGGFRTRYLKCFKFLSRQSSLFQLLKLGRELLFWVRYRKLYEAIFSECFAQDVEKLIFVAGDFVLLHKIAARLSKSLSIPLHVYITDDYLLRYKPDSSPAFRKGIHDRILLTSFRSTFSASSSIYFVSAKMRDVYHDRFNVNGYISFNGGAIGFDKPPKTEICPSKKENIKIKYFGSLHSGRSSAVGNLVSLIVDYNRFSSNKIFLEIYSNSISPVKFHDAVAKDVVKFFEPIKGEELKDVMSDADALLLIESDDVSHLQDTWLSFSTKVMEYLRSRKPVIAFGPMDNPSIGELVLNCSAINVRCVKDFDHLFCPRSLEKIQLNAEILYKSLEKNNTFL